MAAPFALTTADPRFSPSEPVTINGYAFAPVDGAGRAAQPRTKPSRGRSVIVQRARKELAHG